MKSILFLLLVMALAACASFPSSGSAELVTQVATIKFINGGEIPVLRARAVVAIAKEGKRLFDNERLPVSEIETLIRNRIKWDELNVEDALLANALIDRVAAEIQKHSGPEDQRVSGSTALGGSISSAQ